MREQPSKEEKLDMMAGNRNEKWECMFPPPPVHTWYWSNNDWVNFVDMNGVWYKREEKAA